MAILYRDRLFYCMANSIHTLWLYSECVYRFKAPKPLNRNRDFAAANHTLIIVIDLGFNTVNQLIGYL